MNRRRFLRILPIGGALTGLPVWVSNALATDSAFAAVFDDALRRAKSRGKPLLVLLQASSHNEWSDRGGIFGQLLNYGPDELFEDLALCELVCADSAAVRETAPALDGDPLMILIETDTTPTSVLPVSPNVPDDVWGYRSPHPAKNPDWSKGEARKENATDARIRILAEAIHNAIAPNAKTLKRRARAVPSSNTVRLLESAKAGTIALADADTIAAPVALLASTSAAPDAARLRKLLVDVARDRVVKKPVAGSRWASASGCGSRVEYLPGDSELKPHPTAEGQFDFSSSACGMGSVPPKSARFLKFYADQNK